ncbi:MAG: hypothetical protein FWE52_01355 [Alphaproteobacteria bacterium]|nr:hypothetical protein [Alphaproteobacteria bacterium]
MTKVLDSVILEYAKKIEGISYDADVGTSTENIMVRDWKNCTNYVKEYDPNGRHDNYCMNKDVLNANGAPCNAGSVRLCKSRSYCQTCKYTPVIGNLHDYVLSHMRTAADREREQKRRDEVVELREILKKEADITVATMIALQNMDKFSGVTLAEIYRQRKENAK